MTDLRLRLLLRRQIARSVNTLRTSLSGKSIALIGNGSHLLEQTHDIDQHDVVVRMNRGIDLLAAHPQLGKRTDYLLVSGQKVLTAVQQHQAGWQTIWMTPKGRRDLSQQTVRKLLFYPESWWQALHLELGARPSTGAMGIDLFSRLKGTGDVHLYGFDFWTTATTYHCQIRPGPHDPEAERQFAIARVGVAQIHE